MPQQPFSLSTIVRALMTRKKMLLVALSAVALLGLVLTSYHLTSVSGMTQTRDLPTASHRTASHAMASHTTAPPRKAEDLNQDQMTPAKEKQHVFFLKVHKAASTTLQNIMLRFALSRNLVVAMAKDTPILSQHNKKWLRHVMPLPPGRSHYDILCNHLVFHEPSVRSILPADAVYIAIVRQPLAQFVSAFVYYRYHYAVPYLSVIPEEPVSTYLTNPALYEPRDVAKSFTHNRMSFDFGLQPDAMNDSREVSDYVQYLNKTFHLVMVSERFPESMVLMRRTLGWTLKDVLYLKNNVFKHKQLNFTDRQRDTHRRFNMADYMLYEFFSQEFDRKVAAQGPSFVEEVRHFTSVQKRLTNHCNQRGGSTLVIEPSKWNEKFEIPKTDCHWIRKDETQFVNYVRDLMYPQNPPKSVNGI